MLRFPGIILITSLLWAGCTSQSIFVLRDSYRSRNCSISVWPEREWYYVGEEITVHYCVRCGRAQREPISGNAIFNRITVSDKNGKKLSRLSASHGSLGQFDHTFTGSASISTGSSRYYSNKTRDNSTFRHIVPGTYRGKSDFRGRNLKNIEFEFRVLAVPDSLVKAWKKYESLNRIFDYNSVRPDLFLLDDTLKLQMTADAVLDSALILGRYFRNRRVGSLWRYEALGVALSLQSRLKDSLRTRDRFHVEEFVRGYANESRSKPRSVIWRADRLLFSHLEPNARIDSLLAYAGSFENKRFVDAALIHKERILSSSLPSKQ
jgi:hypothetical protein